MGEFFDFHTQATFLKNDSKEAISATLLQKYMGIVV